MNSLFPVEIIPLDAHAAVSIAQVPYEDLQENIRDFLHPSEKDYLSTLRVEKRMRDYLLGRYCAKAAIAHISDENEIGNIPIIRGVYGEPIIQGSQFQPYGVSISHSEGFGAAVAYSESNLAIDIQLVKSGMDRAVKRILTKGEMNYLSLISGKDEENHALLWAVKEATIKFFRTPDDNAYTTFAIAGITPLDENFYAVTYEHLVTKSAFVIKVNGFVVAFVGEMPHIDALIENRAAFVDKVCQGFLGAGPKEEG